MTAQLKEYPLPYRTVVMYGTAVRLVTSRSVWYGTIPYGTVRCSTVMNRTVPYRTVLNRKI